MREAHPSPIQPNPIAPRSLWTYGMDGCRRYLSFVVPPHAHALSRSAKRKERTPKGCTRFQTGCSFFLSYFFLLSSYQVDGGPCVLMPSRGGTHLSRGCSCPCSITPWHLSQLLPLSFSVRPGKKKMRKEGRAERARERDRGGLYVRLHPSGLVPREHNIQFALCTISPFSIFLSRDF